MAIRRRALFLAIALFSVGARADVTLAVDWQSFLADQDLKWNGLPDSWFSGSFIGDGRVGAMIWRDGNTLRFDLGRSDVWDHQANGGLGDFKAGKTRLLIGALQLIPKGAIQGGDTRLDLWNAETRATMKTSQGTIELRALVHSSDVLIIEVVESGNERARFDFVPERARSPWGNDPPIPNPPPTARSDGKTRVVEQRLAAGGGFAVAWAEETIAEHHRVLYLSIGWDREGGSASAQAIDSIVGAQDLGVDSLIDSHRAWWHDYYRESFVSIPDDRLQRFYWVQLYKLASATRADAPIYDLLGPWPKRTRWPGLWWNLNVQMAYWPVYAANRLEEGESLVRALDRALDDGALAENDPEHPDSAALATTTGDDLRNAYPLVENCDLPWAMHNAWLQYRYSMDDDELRNHLLPLLERAINHYLYRLSVSPVTGKLDLPRARSPEYGVGKNPTIDLALLRWGLNTLLAIDTRLNLHHPRRAEWEFVLRNLAPFPVDETGLMVADDMPLNHSHRAFSHLLPIYPLHLLSDPQLAERSIDHWAGHGDSGLFGPHPDRSGFSMAGAASLYASIGRGDRALAYLNGMFDSLPNASITPNTFYSEAGHPTSETPMAAASAIQDLLIQSWGDRIRVFPSLPTAWDEVDFAGLRAEGAFLVSAARRGGRTQFVRVESLSGEPCRLQSDLPTPWEAIGSRVFTIDMESADTATIDLLRGESVILRTMGTTPELAIAPVWTAPSPGIDSPNGCGCHLGARSRPGLLPGLLWLLIVAPLIRRRVI